MAKKKKITKIIIIVIAAMLGLSVITAGAVKLSDDSKRIYPKYHIGSINPETGAYVESDDAIYSDLFECQGLKVEANFSKGVNYSVFFYRFDESFVSAELNKSDVYKAEDNDVIRFARIVITPDKGDKTAEEFKVRVFDIPKFTKNVKVTVYKEQEEIKDLAEVDQKGSWDDVENNEWQRLAPINISNIKQLAFVLEGGIDNVFDDVIYKIGNEGTQGTSQALSEESFTSTVYVLDVENYDGNIYISVKTGVNLKIYKYN